MDTSEYHQHIDHTTFPHRPRPVVVGAPYVLCAFTVGVILMAVGTFITSHAYEEDDKDPVLLGVGPGLLGLGALLLLSAVVICGIACLRNRRLREYFYDDFFTIGSSTFYGDNRVLQLDEEDHMNNSYSVRQAAPTDSNEGIMILANTIAQERERQRINSIKLPRNHSYEKRMQACYVGPQVLSPDGLPREDPEELGLEPIHRAQRYPELADFGLSESDDSIPRHRSYSMSVRRPRPNMTPVEQRLRRNLTYTQASRARLKEGQLQRQHSGQQLLKPAWEPYESGPHRKRSSRRKKSQKKNEVEAPIIHQLPKYDPDLLRALGITTNRPGLQRGISEDGVLASGSPQFPQWCEDPDVTHGSLENPRRRPAVAMGVTGLRPKQSGAAYRHSSSIYASDMEFHRTDATPTTDASEAGFERREFQSHGERTPNLPQPGSSMSSRIHSSPTLLSPYDNGDTSPHPADITRRENTPPPSTPPPPPPPSHSRCRRPLSNISSASESCCSECCDDHQHPMEGPSSEHQHPHSTTTKGELGHPTHHQTRPHTNDANHT